MSGSRLFRDDETRVVAVVRQVFRACNLTIKKKRAVKKNAKSAKNKSAGADEEGAGSVDVSVTFVLDLEMQALNRRWRKKDQTTDVLSFSAVEGEFVVGDDRLLGDLVISVETAARQARAHGHDIDVEVGVLVAHGLLHLCGLDHERGEADAEKQLSVEMNVLAEAGLPVEAALCGRVH